MPPSPTEPKTEKETRNRVRDNQRRSRARRKEYLQDLEQRLRHAEQHGIHASVQVQAAARQVSEENKRLRLLLRHHGVSDASIESYLAATGTAVPPGGGSRAGTPGAAQRLDRLLNPGTNSTATSPRIPLPESRLSTAASSTNSTCAPPSPASPNATNDNNCSMAADLISTMTGVNPHEVRTSLGCTPGMDCHVDNNRIGSAIEYFTESGVVT